MSKKAPNPSLEQIQHKRTDILASMAALFGITLEIYGRRILHITFKNDADYDSWFPSDSDISDEEDIPSVVIEYDPSTLKRLPPKEPDSNSAIVAQIFTLVHPKVKAVFGSSAIYPIFSTALATYGREGTSIEEKINGMSFGEARQAWIIAKRIFVTNHLQDSQRMTDLLMLGDKTAEAIMAAGLPIVFEEVTDKDRKMVIEYCQFILSGGNDIPDDVLLPALGSVPNGESVNWFYRVINSKGGRMVKESPRNRHEDVDILKQRDSLRFIRKNKESGTTTIVEVAQADKYLSKNKTFAKTMLFALQKMNAQNFPLEVGFSLQELVDLGMYSTTSNAGRAIKEFFAQQRQIMLSGSVKKNNKTIKEEGGVLFYHYRLQNGYVKLSVNENFNMSFIANYFTVFPRFAYSLGNNAFNLVRYIFSIARQNTKSIKETGTFNISLRAVQENLGLPAPEDVKNRKYKQYIVDPIEAAIEEIEAALVSAPEAKEYGFTITPVGTDTSNINQWLDGYLKIGLNGDFATTFVKLASNAEKAQEAREKAKLNAVAKIEAQRAQNEKA